MERQWTANPPFIGSNPIAASSFIRLVNMNKLPLAIRLSLLAVAVLMFVSGYIWGNPVVIWQKAATICLECIGIG